MAATIYYASDADSTKLEGKKIAILGYGSQGHAHALNLQDSGHDVIVGLYKGSSSIKKAEEDGLTVMESSEACKNADLIVIHTEWNEFKQLNFKKLVAKKGFKIYDLRNLYSVKKMTKDKISYFGIGR